MYDKDGKFIKYPVSKERPCHICEAENNKAHTNYCPNGVG